MMKLSQAAWAAWALVPVGAMAWHFGPGQCAFRHDRAVDLQSAALTAQDHASALQEQAYAAHLAALKARQAAFVSNTPETDRTAQELGAAETRAFTAAAEAWKSTADAFGAMQDAAQVDGDSQQPAAVEQARLLRSRALVRSGDVWTGVDELEAMLDATNARGEESSSKAVAIREELASAYYCGARLMRMAGESDEQWRPEAAKARQHFRFLAERAREGALPGVDATAQQKNVEVVLDLEQASAIALEGKPLPKNCAGQCKNPSKGSKCRKPPQQKKDARGAGGAGDIPPGW